MEYQVTVRKQFPAWDEKEGFVYTVSADSKSKAIKNARRQAENDGHVGFGQGRAFFSATEVTESS